MRRGRLLASRGRNSTHKRGFCPTLPVDTCAGGSGMIKWSRSGSGTDAFMQRQHPEEVPIMKKTLCILAVFLFFVLASGTSYACTGIYIGKEASADGTLILARSNDCPRIYATRMMTVPHVESDPGRNMPVDSSGSKTLAITD